MDPIIPLLAILAYLVAGVFFAAAAFRARIAGYAKPPTKDEEGEEYLFALYVTLFWPVAPSFYLLWRIWIWAFMRARTKAIAEFHPPMTVEEIVGNG